MKKCKKNKTRVTLKVLRKIKITRRSKNESKQLEPKRTMWSKAAGP